jgi:nicotinamide phosphoribosyltransferase
MNINPFLATDGYKTGHHKMYPQGTTLVYSNFTPRHGKHSNTDLGGVISFGQQMVMKQIKEMFDENFFKTVFVNNIKGAGHSKEELNKYLGQVRDSVCQEIKKEYSLYLGEDYDVSHIEALWDLGYLPIKVKVIPEGTFVPYGVPVLTIVNTKPEFFWLTNFLETLISNMLWMPMTAATTAYSYKQLLTKFAKSTDSDNVGFVDFQGHNFGMRGMAGLDATVYSGLGHATSFLGDDSLPTIHAARKYYGETGAVVHSVNATEHSVMCAGGDQDELETFRYLMKQFPKGILSIVSDTWDLWKVLTEFLPTLKEEILNRDGKIVIRPDSGNPVDIICGAEQWLDKEAFATHSHRPTSHQNKGVIELLWDLFGGTINSQGYKVLDPHIGAIYGDSITLDRAKQICERLEAKGFASTNVVLGVGSYTYQYVTRDTHGFAMKATYVEITEDGDWKSAEGREIFKDPITDDGGKKSAKGLLSVYRDSGTGELILQDQEDWSYEDKGILQTIFEDGEFKKEITLTEIRNMLND